jgi:hypothetical protein
MMVRLKPDTTEEAWTSCECAWTFTRRLYQFTVQNRPSEARVVSSQ